MLDSKAISVSDMVKQLKDKNLSELLVKIEAISEDDIIDSKILCPFHEEKTPSLMLYEDGYYCFGCGEHGDVVSFICSLYGLSFIESVSWIADKLNVELKLTHSPKNPFIKSDNNENRNSRKTLINSLEKEWQSYLSNASNIEEESMKRKLREFFPLEVGYDKSIRYFVLRYTSKTGETLGFTKRRAFDIPDDIKSKYPKWKHSSSKTSLISECFNIYNLNNSSKYIKNLEEVILVEGPKDVIPWIMEGKKNVVAISGTSNTQNIFTLLPPVKRIILSLDGDEAGLKGSVSIAKNLSNSFDLSNLLFVDLESLDPYDFYKKNGELKEVEPFLKKISKDYLKELFKEASPYNRSLIVNELSLRENITYEEAESFFKMGNDLTKLKKKKQKEDEISKLIKAGDLKSAEKLSLKYGF